MSKVLAGVLLILSAAIGGIAAIVVYVVSAVATNLLVVNLSLAALAFFLICYGLTRFIARKIVRVPPHPFALGVSIVITLILALVAACPTLKERVKAYPDNASAQVLQALRAHAIPLKTVRAGSGFDDLQPLRSILMDKRIVALGEATHGTREFFQMKHRLLEFLVREMGFQHFGMELSPADGQVLNDYIMGEEVDPRQVLYWPWATAEVLEMLDWMRAYNADPTSPYRLTLHGIDPIVGQRDIRMAENVAAILEQAGPQSKIVLWAHNMHISNAAGWMGHELEQQWGEQAYLLGFEFNLGAFTSRMATIHTYRVSAASPDYYAYALAKLDEPILLLDFERMSQDAELRGWLAKPQSSHDLQELHAIFRLNPAWYTLRTSWLQLYDGIIYIEESTPARGLP